MRIQLLEADDWQALYINGQKTVEGHRLHPKQVDDQLSEWSWTFPQEYNS